MTANQKNPKRHKKAMRNKLRSYTSQRARIDLTSLESWHRAEIVIHGVDGSALSYEGRVFLNNPNADQETLPSLDNGYVGSYHVFGYGGLFPGDVYREKDRFDYRQFQSPVIPYKRIVITDALRRLGQRTTEFSITIVPVLPVNGLMENRRRKNTRSFVTSRLNIIRLDKIGIIIR